MTRYSNCSLCTEGFLSVGEKSDYGAMVVLKTGKDPRFDWYASLSPGTMTSKDTGVHCLLMPLGHVGTFAELGKSRELAENYGFASGRISYAMQTILEEEWEQRGESGLFVPNQIVYGKHAPGRNTKPGHLHIRFSDYSGGLAQAYPSDNGWRKKEVWEDDGGTEFVKGKPTLSEKFSPERFEKLASRLVELCNH